MWVHMYMNPTEAVFFLKITVLAKLCCVVLPCLLSEHFIDDLSHVSYVPCLSFSPSFILLIYIATFSVLCTYIFPCMYMYTYVLRIHTCMVSINVCGYICICVHGVGVGWASQGCHGPTDSSPEHHSTQWTKAETHGLNACQAILGEGKALWLCYNISGRYTRKLLYLSSHRYPCIPSCNLAPS